MLGADSREKLDLILYLSQDRITAFTTCVSFFPAEGIHTVDTEGSNQIKNILKTLDNIICVVHTYTFK